MRGLDEKWAASWQNQQMACAPSEGSDYPGYPPSQIRVFFVRLKKAMILSYPLSAQRRLWSDWADAKAGLSLRWVHMHFFLVLSRAGSNNAVNNLTESLVIALCPLLYFYLYLTMVVLVSRRLDLGLKRESNSVSETGFDIGQEKLWLLVG